MTAAIGLSDLARLFHRVPLEQREEHAAWLGFRRSDLPAPWPDAPGQRVHVERTSALGAESAGTLEPQMRFWRIETAVERDLPSIEESPAEEGLSSMDLDTRCSLTEVPPSPLLAPWPTLWSRLRAALHGLVESREPDIPALVQIWARGARLDRIPRLARRTWATAVTIWIDRSARLVPFWGDQDAVRFELERLCGPGAIEVRNLDANLQAVTSERHGDLVGRRRLDPTAPLLVLGDLGFYGTERDRTRWAGSARRLRHAGIRIAALVPCSPLDPRWDRELARAWNAMPWERSEILRELSIEERVHRLLRLVAPTFLAQPGLLRALRQLLPASDADASTEVDAWQHRDVRAADITGLVLDAAASGRLRAEFADLDPVLQANVRALIEAWHCNLPPELLHAEALVWLSWNCTVPPGDVERAKAFVGKVAATAWTQGGDDDAPGIARDYGRQLLGAMRDGLYEQVPALKKLWSVTRARLSGERRPATIAAHEVRTPGPRPSSRWWALHQCGDSLIVAAMASRAWPAGRAPGSPVATLAAANPTVWVRRGVEPAPVAIRLEQGASIPLPPEERLVLDTDLGHEITLGVWECAPWAAAVGRDGYGLWAAFEVVGVRHRMRWIPPGRFLMGSPATEVGRLQDEGPQHWVTLSEGYWLGETPVTQALWRAVMTYNPSRFVGDERPVEQVSWDDCCHFITRLNDSLDGLEARLPTEAEWERACRAGTDAATWAGDLTLRGDNDAPELDGIAWYGGNSGIDFELADGYDSSRSPEKHDPHTQAGTHPVARREANPYGLHDMLGNVFEWCEDTGMLAYTSEPAVDPSSPTHGSLRILRGGSWHSDARLVRAATRSASERGSCASHVGFRLAGGPSARSPAVGTSLNPGYTFDTFTVGPSNQLAFAASQAAASSYPPKYNPVFLCGAEGFGRTHLMHSIGNQQLANRPSLRIAYLSSERFMNEYVQATRTGRMREFRRNYREGIDVLLLDDVQFLAGNESAQDEFFHTFNALFENHKQIVLTADRKPHEISNIADRLLTRFAWGLLADIEPPELEVRIAILRKKAAVESVSLPDDVALYIASSIKSNVRELEGALIRLAAYASLSKRRIDLEFAQEALGAVITRRHDITVDSVIEAVASYYGLKPSDIKSERRHKSVATPRAVAMYISRHHTVGTYPELARAFGGKHYTTVISAVQKIIERVKDDASLRHEIHAIESTLLR